MPAKAGIPANPRDLDSGFHRVDVKSIPLGPGVGSSHFPTEAGLRPISAEPSATVRAR